MKKILKVMGVIAIVYIMLFIIFAIYMIAKLVLFNKCNIQDYDENFNYKWCELVKDF